MLELDRRAAREAVASATLTLPWDRRGVTRQRVRLDDGREAGLFLPRGEILRGGDRVATADGLVVAIVAAREPVLRVTASTPRDLARAAYHLGNRHIAVEVVAGGVALQLEPDHVLRAMLEGLGVVVEEVIAPFEPEAGAYGGHGGHGHGPSHRRPGATVADRLRATVQAGADRDD
jgi:urease accessory protein